VCIRPSTASWRRVRQMQQKVGQMKLMSTQPASSDQLVEVPLKECCTSAMFAVVKQSCLARRRRPTHRSSIPWPWRHRRLFMVDLPTRCRLLLYTDACLANQWRRTAAAFSSLQLRTSLLSVTGAANAWRHTTVADTMRLVKVVNEPCARWRPCAPLIGFGEVAAFDIGLTLQTLSIMNGYKLSSNDPDYMCPRFAVIISKKTLLASNFLSPWFLLYIKLKSYLFRRNQDDTVHTICRISL